MKTSVSATSPRTRIAFKIFICSLFFCLLIVLFLSVFYSFLVFVWLYFSYIVDYYIYKALEGCKMEKKNRRYSAKTVFFYQLSQSIEVFFENKLYFCIG